MKYLADTHILLWALEGNSNLTSEVTDIFLNEQNQIYYSFINVWEVSIKHTTHPDDIACTAGDFFDFCNEAGFLFLNASPQHAVALENLQYDEKAAPRLHKDPFDRMLLAQAKTEGMAFLTHDELLPFYNEDCVVKV